MTITNQIEPEIINTKDLLKKERLAIPKYQRPYKWSVKNVNQLIDDLIQHKDKSAYRLGTIVFYKDDNDELNIVDGQQRTITLLLIGLALSRTNGRLREDFEKAKIKPVNSTWFEGLLFSNPTSIQNIKDNYREIVRRVDDFDLDTALFFYEKCELVQVVIQDISEAFQFFDSQNARGKDLDPHDLLKAFHLREMSGTSSEEERLKSVSNWEHQDTEELKRVFALYLYRIRNWSKGKPARDFTKQEVDLFKGISPQIKEPYPFANLYRIGHFYTEGYNKDFNRNIDNNRLNYPFQLDQVIINGKRFFEMVDHYISVFRDLQKIETLSDEAKEIYTVLESYGARGRRGDQYIRNLFDCCLIYYWDKFEMAEMDRAVEKFFVWAYSLRLQRQNVQLASIDNYALEPPFIFNAIREALQPSDILNIKIPVVDKVISTRTEEIEELFKKLRYLD